MSQLKISFGSMQAFHPIMWKQSQYCRTKVIEDAVKAIVLNLFIPKNDITIMGNRLQEYFM